MSTQQLLLFLSGSPSPGATQQISMFTTQVSPPRPKMQASQRREKAGRSSPPTALPFQGACRAGLGLRLARAQASLEQGSTRSYQMFQTPLLVKNGFTESVPPPFFFLSFFLSFFFVNGKRDLISHSSFLTCSERTPQSSADAASAGPWAGWRRRNSPGIPKTCLKVMLLC